MRRKERECILIIVYNRVTTYYTHMWGFQMKTWIGEEGSMTTTP
ncbi:hypothetical protein [Reichenbachiella sp.]